MSKKAKTPKITLNMKEWRRISYGLFVAHLGLVKHRELPQRITDDDEWIVIRWSDPAMDKLPSLMLLSSLDKGMRCYERRP